MKRINFFAIMVIAIFSLVAALNVTPATAQFNIVNKGGSGSGGGGDAPFTVSYSGGVITITAPFSADQTRKEGVRASDFNLHASYVYYDVEGGWNLVAQPTYILSGSGSGSQVTGRINADRSGRYLWFRVWGKHKRRNSGPGTWLWIIQGDSYCRKSQSGYPGYEFVVDTKTGRVSHVPPHFPRRP